MDPERADRVEQLYHSALERDARERDAFLRQACSDDLHWSKKFGHCWPRTTKLKASWRVQLWR